MKKLILLFLISFATTVWAGCPALEYQEMKDMPAQDLTVEYCKATEKAVWYHDRMTDIMSAWMLENNETAKRLLSISSTDRQEQSFYCENQADRIKRVLLTKNVSSEQLKSSCPIKKPAL